MSWWTLLGSWIVLGMAVAALLFSMICFLMIRQILRHVLKFNPDNLHQQIAEIHEETVNEGSD